MYFNTFASGSDAMDLTQGKEFANLLQGAKDFNIPHRLPVKCISRNIVANGIRFHLLEWGEPSSPDLLLLHGGQLSAHTWDFVSLNMAGRYHVIAIDWRGHGDTEWPRDFDMSFSSLVADLAGILEALGLQRPLIMAHSMGARILLGYLKDHDIASKAVIVDMAPEGTREGGGEPADRGGPERWQFPSVDAYVDGVIAQIPSRTREQVMMTMGYNLLQRIDGSLVSKTIRRSGWNIGYERNRESLATLEDVKRITIPVLILRGERSRELSPEAAQRFEAALPNGRLITVPNCGHNVHSENTLGLLEAVTPFFAD